jgi:hypothetical protein
MRNYIHSILIIALKHKNAIGLLFVVLYTCLIYAKVVYFEFIDWDDPVQITNNPFMKNGLTITNIKNVFCSHVAKMYQPLTTLLYVIESTIFGLNPAVFHLTSLFIHLCNTVLIYFILKLLFPNITTSLIIGLVILFAIHPINAGAVCWLSSRSTLLFCFFYFLAIGSWIKYRTVSKRYLYFLTLSFFIFSLLSKVMSVSLPLVIIGIDFFYFKKKLALKKSIVYLPFLFFSGLFGVIGFMLRNAGVSKGLSNNSFSFFDTPFLISYQYLWYLKNVFYPINLQSNYADPSFPSLLFYLVSGLIGGVAIFVFFKNRKHRLFLIGLVLLILPLLPVLKLIPIGHSIIADRYFYIGFLGLLILITFFFDRVTKLKKMLTVISCVFIIGCSWQSWQEQEKWRNNVSIWSDAINSGLCNNNCLVYEARSLAYFKQKEYGLAFYDAKKAIQLAKKNNKEEAYLNKLNALLSELNNKLNK